MMSHDNFDPHSRVWIYLSARPFSDDEVKEIDRALQDFVKVWTAHGANLKASGKVYFNRFVILMVDESAAGASGCSIDKSVHFIKDLQEKYKVELFNRLLFAWKKDDEIHVSHLSELRSLVDEGMINEKTIVFNNTLTTKQEFDDKWMIPLGASWMKSKLSYTKML